MRQTSTTQCCQGCQQPSERQCGRPCSLPSSPNYRITKGKAILPFFQIQEPLLGGRVCPRDAQISVCFSCSSQDRVWVCRMGSCPHGTGWWVGFLLLPPEGSSLALNLGVSWHSLSKPVVVLPHWCFFGKVTLPGSSAPWGMCPVSLPVSLKSDHESLLVSSRAVRPEPSMTGLICSCQVDLLFRSSWTVIELGCPILMAGGEFWVTIPRGKEPLTVLSWQLWPRSDQPHLLTAYWPEPVT